MINLGVRAHDLGKSNPEELAKKVQAHGFSSIQLALHKALHGFDNFGPRLSPGLGNYIRDIFWKHNINISILGCYINPIHPEKEIRENSIQRFEEHLRFARDFGCSTVATETGYCATEKEEDFLQLVDVVKRLCYTAERYGAIVGIEGVSPNSTIHTHERMVRLIDTVNSPNVQVVYDPANFIPVDLAEKHEENIKEAFELFGHRIICIHAKDFSVSNGQKNTTLPSGKGLMNYHFFFELLKKHTPGIHVLLENNTPGTISETLDFIRKIDSSQENQIDFL